MTIKTALKAIKRSLVNISLLKVSLLGALIIFSTNSVAEKKNKPKPPFPLVKIETSLGAFTVELYPNEAPITVDNFLQYVDDDFYAGTTFHRIAPGFVVQAGGYTYDFQIKETREPIKNEADNKLYNLTATLSMARTSDPDSATSQFFVNLKHNAALDYDKDKSAGYAVFGKVIEGFEVIKKIEKEPRGLYRSRPEAPNYPVIIERAYRVESK